MLQIRWNTFTLISQMGKTYQVHLHGYNDNHQEAYALLQAISRMPKEGKKPISLADSYQAMLRAMGEPIFQGVEGSGEDAARMANQGFVKTATDLGYYIRLSGDEFEVLNMAS